MPFLVPIFTAISAWWASTALGSFLIGIGITGKMLIGIGINVVGTIIQRQLAKKAAREVGGVQFERQYGANVPRQVAIGLVGIAGHDCYVNTYGETNRQLQQLYTVSDFYCSGLSRVAINGKYVTLGGEHPQRGRVVTSGDFANLIWVKFIDGRQTTANDYLIDNSYPSGRWTEDHIGLGVAHIIVSMVHDQEKNATFPDFFFEFFGAPLYDWRKDSTQAGGSGSHRWNDLTTWEYSENPIVAEYNYRRGFAINNDVFCGMEMPASDLPLDKWTAAANICDEEDPDDDQARYRVSLMIDCSATHKENIEAISLACGSMIVDGVGGSWPIVGSDQPVVATFTDDDLIAGQPVKYRNKRSMNQLVNSVGGQYPDPEQLWSMTGYGTQTATAYLALDRRTRDLNINFSQVRHARQAEQLAHIYLYENRYEATATVTLRSRFRVLECGDWVRWNSARYGNKVYIVQSATIVSLDEENPRCITLSLQERDGEIYDGITPSIPVVPTPPGVPVYLEQLDNFQATPVVVLGDTGAEQPGIRASWNAITDLTVAYILLQYWPTNEPTNIVTKQIPVDQLTILLTEGIVSNTEYQIRTRVIPNVARVTNWSSLISVTTPNVVPDFYPIDLEDLADDIADWQEWVGNGQREVERRLEELDLWIADQTFSTRFERNTIRQQLKATTDVSRAEWTQQIDVVATEVGAIASDVTTLNAQLQILNGTVSGQATAISGLQSSVTALDGSLIAQAAAITELSASTSSGDVLQANFRMQLLTGPTGYSRMGAQTRQGGAGSWRGAAWYLDTPNNPALPTRFVVDAQQFIVTDTSSGTLAAPMVWVGGVLYASALRVQWANIDNIVIGWADIETAVVNNFVATSANIGDLTIGPEKMPLGALRKVESGTGGTASPSIPSTGWITLATITVPNPSGGPIDLFAEYVQINDPPGGTGQFRVVRDSISMMFFDYGPFAAGSTRVDYVSWCDTPGVGTFNYTVQRRQVSGAWNGAATLKASYSLR